MKILILHPEDAFDGPWSRERWDSIIDLGRAPQSFYQQWSTKLGCPVYSIFDLAVEIEDLRVWRGLLQLGQGRVIDRFGIDWWTVISLLLQREMQDFRLVQRLAEKIRNCQSLVTSRPSRLADALSLQLGCRMRVLQASKVRSLARDAERYARAVRNLNFEQFRQVIYDKYDAQYALRRMFHRRAPSSSKPVVLLPSAYSNVTRTAIRYASVLPDQRFLLVLARESAAVSHAPDNVETSSLAAFAPKGIDQSELCQMEEDWDRLEGSLRDHPDFHLCIRFDVLRKGKRWLRWGVLVRDAWNSVFDRRLVVGCLSADDSNPYSRIPLLLALRRNIPAVACTHGALDAGMALKPPGFSKYLVKGEMEQDYVLRVCGVDESLVAVGAPPSALQTQPLWTGQAPWIVFFTEPYEVDYWRAEEIHREVVPRICAAARQAKKRVMLKLHPFESLRQRQRMLKRLLSEKDREVVDIDAGPMSRELLKNTWCAVSVESTTATECASAGIPAFLCGWLRHAYLGYALQYARFGVVTILESANDLPKIPGLIGNSIPDSGIATRLFRAIPPPELEQILCHRQATALR